MAKQSSTMKIANMMAKKIIADQTRARLAMGFDAAILAAHEVFGMGPGRSAAFADAYNKAMEQLADMFIADCDENHDEQLAYAKAQRDEAIRRIVGDGNFVPFDLYYGQAYMDELKRIRIMEGKT
jgi:hypothetical protein